MKKQRLNLSATRHRPTATGDRPSPQPQFYKIQETSEALLWLQGIGELLRNYRPDQGTADDEAIESLINVGWLIQTLAESGIEAWDEEFKGLGVAA